MFKRRRKFKGTWLPTLGDAYDPPDGQSTAQWFNCILDNGDGVSTIVFPLLPDLPREDFNDTASNSLSDFIGNEYALRRIVGKAFIYIFDTDATPLGAQVAATLGFFVARTDHADENLPIGVSAATFTHAADADQTALYSPGANQTQRQPWIWRRRWVLATDGGTLTGFPRTNVAYGSVLDGPHIDAKTRRRVRREERLFGALSAQFVPETQDEGAGSVTLGLSLDCRYFGALRRSKAQGAF